MCNNFLNENPFLYAKIGENNILHLPIDPEMNCNKAHIKKSRPSFKDIWDLSINFEWMLSTKVVKVTNWYKRKKINSEDKFHHNKETFESGNDISLSLSGVCLNASSASSIAFINKLTSCSSNSG